MGNWEPRPSGGQLSIITYSVDELIAETSVSIDDMIEWNKLDWLSFFPQHSEQYQPFHKDEIIFIASLVRFGLSKAMIGRILKDLSKPYYYNPELMAFNFFKRKWQQLPALSEEELKDSWFKDYIHEYLEELLEEEDLYSLRNLQKNVEAALKKLNGGDT